MGGRLLRKAMMLAAGFLPVWLGAQATQMNDQRAKAAVYRIARYSGLQPDFVLQEDRDIPSAIAFIKGRKRYIAYNPTMMAGVLDSTRTDWSAVSILAHEIAHHLLGHTLDPGQVNPGDELACDAYSGFILRNMGASLEESLAAMRVAGHPVATNRHPGREARLEAIRQGWSECERIHQGQQIMEIPDHQTFSHSLTLEGDPNTYYINDGGQLVWFNNMAQPIALGRLEQVSEHGYRQRIVWNQDHLFVDGGGVIWTISAHGAQSPVGRLADLQGTSK